MSNSYLHIFHDEKFTNTIVEQFLLTNVDNQRFIVIHSNSILKPEYKLNKELPIETITIGSQGYNDLINDLNNYDFLFIHYLDNDKLDIIDKAPNSMKIIWMCWGQDIHKLVISNSYLPKTRNLLLKNKLYNEYFWKYTLWLRRLIIPYTKKGQLLKKIGYCCPVIKEDLELVNNKLNLNIKYIPFHYGWLELILGTQLNGYCTSNNILIGNSSTYASNHLDTFNILKKFKLDEKKIIVPLNYGNKEYGDIIETEGKRIFNNNFIPLRKFISSNEYSSLLSSCSIAIFNHIRQQALGNIIISLWLGAKVYMNDKSVLYKNLKKTGLNIFSIQKDLNIDNKDALNKLKSHQQENNKKILLKEFSKKNVIKLTKEVFNLINE